ncbi:hypothetical protein F6Y04_07275 [Bacillus megaterium]|nr:hypothetical protein [Priestia megaterium]
MNQDRQAALEQALKQIERQFGKGAIMKLGEQAGKSRRRSERLAGARHRVGRRRLPARANRRDLRSGIVRENDRCPSCDR